LNFSSRYFTIIVQKTIYENKDFNLILAPKDIDKRTEIGVQFRNSYGAVVLFNTVYSLTIENEDPFGYKQDFNLRMTLQRNETNSTGSYAKCMTHTLYELNAEKKQFYTFIQTDKPVYKHGDTVMFRVLIVDKELKPYNVNNLNIRITDPHNRPIKEIGGLKDFCCFKLQTVPFFSLHHG